MVCTSGLLLVSLALASPGDALPPQSATGAPVVRQDEEAAYLKALVRADNDERAAALEEALANVDTDRVIAALAERVDRHERTLGRGTAIKKLGKFVEVRQEVDTLRKDVLDLIEDEERYQNVSPGGMDASSLAAVQREIDRMVRELETLWTKTKPVKISGKMQAALEDVRWCLDALADIPAPAELPDWAPTWLMGIDPTLDAVGMPEFAMSPREARRLARERAIRTRNREHAEAAMKDKSLPKDQRPTRTEFEQVIVTNNYRAMLGRPVLAWHPLLQAATRMHSDYMAKYGVLSHYEDRNPERRTPVQRAEIAGYKDFQGENCAMGLSSPEEVHAGWCTSPGHHRNIVLEDHTEMAAAIAGAYWTQNYGRGRVKLEGHR